LLKGASLSKKEASGMNCYFTNYHMSSKALWVVA